jgi:pyruvate/2-oxoglutarate dehydrogenase complex dihydrolipoamide acyltransferase (E2) component
VNSHFKTGDPLYIIEVMKMFNKVSAPFSGTIQELLIEGDGCIIKKGQPLFRITPDEMVEVEPADVIKARRKRSTDTFIASYLEKKGSAFSASADC